MRLHNGPSRGEIQHCLPDPRLVIAADQSDKKLPIPSR